MRLSFIDNFIAPLELPAGQEEVQTSLDLPDGEYILTMADNTASPTRYEVVFAWSEDGITWIWRNPDMGLAEWPEGSVIFCGINSVVLRDVYYSLEAYKEAVGGSGWSLRGDVGLIELMALSFTPFAYLSVDSEQPAGTVTEHVIQADLNPDRIIRLDGGGRPIVKAHFQNHSYLTFSIAPDGSYVDIGATVAALVRMRLQTHVALYSKEAVHLVATFENLSDEFAWMSSAAPNDP